MKKEKLETTLFVSNDLYRFGGVKTRKERSRAFSGKCEEIVEKSVVIVKNYIIFFLFLLLCFQLCREC